VARRDAEKVEDLTRQLETKVAGNAKVKKIESISRTGLSVIYVELVEALKDTGKEFDDIRLNSGTSAAAQWSRSKSISASIEAPPKRSRSTGVIGTT
jgi:multidrug efflux pump subunit AcrB